MRVLSVPQPFAQLIVRGAKCFEARSWTTDYRGRIAIHATGAVPPGSIMQQWDDDAIMAQYCAEQGWVDRDDLKHLPRGAIVGTVEVVDMLRARDVRGEPLLQPFREEPPFADQLLKSVLRDDGMPAAAPTEFAMNGHVPNDHFLWKLAHPVEITPVERITGKLNLWKLADDAARAVTAAEAEAHRSASIRVPNEERRLLSLKAWKARCVIRDEALERRYREYIAQHAGAPARVQFDDLVTEQHVERALNGYLERHRMEESANGTTVQLSARLKPFFGGRAWVSFSELEDTIRVVLARESTHRESLAVSDDVVMDAEVAAEPADFEIAGDRGARALGGAVLTAAVDYAPEAEGELRA